MGAMGCMVLDYLHHMMIMIMMSEYQDLNDLLLWADWDRINRICRMRQMLSPQALPTFSEFLEEWVLQRRRISSAS
jgi:hypothetical protein